MICCSFALRRASQPRPMLGKTIASRNIQMLRFTRRGGGYHVVRGTGRDGAHTPPPLPAEFVSAALLIFIRVILELHRLPARFCEGSAGVHLPGGFLEFLVLLF